MREFTSRSTISSASNSVSLSIAKLKTAARSSSSSAYWPTNFFYEEPSRAKKGIGGGNGREGRQTTRVFAYRDESARRDVRFAWVSRYIRVRDVGGLWSLRGLHLRPKCIRTSPRQFLRGAISFVIYFAGGNSCFRNAIRAWPLPPRLTTLAGQGEHL